MSGNQTELKNTIELTAVSAAPNLLQQNSTGNQIAVDLAVSADHLQQAHISPTPQSPQQSSIGEPPAADRASVVARSRSVRFFDGLFHDHSHPHHEHHKADEDLPGYSDPSVAPIMAGVKAGISKAAPFAFLNYILLLTIL